MSIVSAISAPRFSRYGLYCVLSFFIWTVLLRVVLPFGDEPDFGVRAIELVEGYHPFWVPYHWLGELLNELQVESHCEVHASQTTIFGYIESTYCKQGFEQIFYRVVITLACCAPLFFVVVHRRALHKVLQVFRLRLKANELNERLDALGISLLIPGMIYYLGLLSHEQFTLVISLFISVVWGNWILVLGLATFTSVLDLGNGAVIFGFLAIYFFVSLIWKSFGLKGLVIFIIGGGVSAIIVSHEFMKHVQVLPLLMERAEAIYVKSLTADFLEKYPIVLRPVITFITGVFMTPTGIKAAPVQLMFAVAIAVGLVRLRKRLQQKMKLVATESNQSQQLTGDISGARLMPFAAALTTIIFFTFMLPDYANAKYYMFLAPFLVLPFMLVFGRRSLHLFMNVSCAVVLVFLALQYI